jgi:TonB family protein
MLEITIGPDGRVTDTDVINSIPLLDEAAREAVSQWQFAPTVVDGNAVPVTMTVAVPFARSEPTPPRSPANAGDSPRTADGEGAIRRAQGAEAQQDYDTALREFQNALSRDPDNGTAREGLARVSERRNRADRFVRQATTLFNAGDYEGATASVNRALEAYPRHPGASELLKKIQTAREAEQARRKRPGQRL